MESHLSESIMSDENLLPPEIANDDVAPGESLDKPGGGRRRIVAGGSPALRQGDDLSDVDRIAHGQGEEVCERLVQLEGMDDAGKDNGKHKGDQTRTEVEGEIEDQKHDKAGHFPDVAVDADDLCKDAGSRPVAAGNCVAPVLLLVFVGAIGFHSIEPFSGIFVVRSDGVHPLGVRKKGPVKLVQEGNVSRERKHRRRLVH
mmetsp:Transcript_40303/g.94703  ORF Transcript_40303/g.94703 Transcript_40303/m.94703 type:complete len:201 (+) Transcript_40303:657-1259(+)